MDTSSNIINKKDHITTTTINNKSNEPRESEFLRRQNERLNGLKALRQQRRRQRLVDGDIDSTSSSNCVNNLGGESFGDPNNNDKQQHDPSAIRTRPSTTTATTSGADTAETTGSSSKGVFAVDDEIPWLRQQLNEWRTKLFRISETMAIINNNTPMKSEDMGPKVVSSMPRKQQEPQQQQLSRQQQLQIRDIRGQIGQLQLELYVLRNQLFVAASDAASAGAPVGGGGLARVVKDNNNNTSNNDQSSCSLLQKVVQLHDEFRDGQSAVEKIKEELLLLLPNSHTKGKFTFRRYHEAVMNRKLSFVLEPKKQQQQLDMPTGATLPCPMTATTSTNTSATFHPDRLEGYRDAVIHVYSDSIAITSTAAVTTDDNDDGGGDTGIHPVRHAVDRPPVILSNLERCQVYYCLHETTTTPKTKMDHAEKTTDGDGAILREGADGVISLSQVHVVNSSDFLVDFGGSDGDGGHDGRSRRQTRRVVIQALRVDHCADCTFRKATAQQVRLHDSVALTCECPVTAGAILEGCRQVHFYNLDDQDVGDDHHHQKVRDFQWLQTGVPSPNFTIHHTTPPPPREAPEPSTPNSTKDDQVGGFSYPLLPEFGEAFLPNTPTNTSTDSSAVMVVPNNETVEGAAESKPITALSREDDAASSEDEDDEL